MKKGNMCLTCLKHSNTIRVSFMSLLKDEKTDLLKLFNIQFTSIRSIELDDVGGS